MNADASARLVHHADVIATAGTIETDGIATTVETTETDGIVMTAGMTETDGIVTTVGAIKKMMELLLQLRYVVTSAIECPRSSYRLQILPAHFLLSAHILIPRRYRICLLGFYI